MLAAAESPDVTSISNLSNN